MRLLPCNSMLTTGDQEQAKLRKKHVGHMNMDKDDREKPRTPEELCLLLIHPVTGIDVKNRKYRLKSYKNCFVGKLTPPCQLYLLALY